MNISEQQQNLIDAYLIDELTEGMRQNFERELATDEAFKKEFIFQQSLTEAARLEPVKEAMEQARVDNLLDNKTAHPKFEIVQNSLGEAKAENMIYLRRQRIKKLIIGGLTAACIVLVSLGGWSRHLKKDVEKELSHVNIVLSTDLSDMQQVSGRKEVIEYKLKEAKKAYETEDFEEVLRLFEELQKNHYYQSDELIYTQAIAHTRMENYTESILLLEKLIRKKSNIEYDARWYVALVYLKINEKNKAKSQFNILVQNSEKHELNARKKLQKHYFL